MLPSSFLTAKVHRLLKTSLKEGPRFPTTIYLSALQVCLWKTFHAFLLQLLAYHHSFMQQMSIEHLHIQFCSRLGDTALNSTNRYPLSWHLHSSGERDHKQRKENIRIVKSALLDIK